MTTQTSIQSPHCARYIDSGFYRISDRAAGALVATNGESLPRVGWCKRVPLVVLGECGTAELIRTAVSHTLSPTMGARPVRGWVWALHGFTPENEFASAFRALGKEFNFSPLEKE